MSHYSSIFDKLPATASIADISTRQSWTGAALTQKILRRSLELSSFGASSNTAVILSSKNSTELLFDILAVWQLGATAVPISSSFSDREVEHLVISLAPSLVMIEGEKLDHVLFASPKDQKPTSKIFQDEQPLLVLVTSGTSGTPKLVSISETAFLNRIKLNNSEIEASTLSNTLVLLPLHFGHGLIGNALTALFAGGTIYLGAQKDISGLSKLGELIDELNITFLSSVPSLWRMVLKLSPAPKTDCLQRIHFGSEPVSSDLWRAIDTWGGAAETFNMYGMTETANWISGISGSEAGFVSGSVGRPWGGEFALRSEDGKLMNSLKQGELGEILVKSPSIMTEYLGNEADTKDAFHDGWFVTGDLGKFDEKGGLRIVGRLKNQINCAGIKVSIEEIDQLLESHPDILEACSFAAPDPISGEVVAAAVVLSASSDISVQDIQSWCRDLIRKEAAPAMLWTVDSLAKTSRGKLDRKSVQELMLHPDQT